ATSSLLIQYSSLTIPTPPTSTLFPYTTLFRSIYHEGVPYVKKLEERCMEIVQAQGFIRTISGRKRRFKKWEPRDWDLKRTTRPRSEEHTSELQSRENLVCRLLLEKKKKKNIKS